MRKLAQYGRETAECLTIVILGKRLVPQVMRCHRVVKRVDSEACAYATGPQTMRDGYTTPEVGAIYVEYVTTESRIRSLKGRSGSLIWVKERNILRASPRHNMRYRTFRVYRTTLT